MTSGVNSGIGWTPRRVRLDEPAPKGPEAASEATQEEETTDPRRVTVTADSQAFARRSVRAEEQRLRGQLDLTLLSSDPQKVIASGADPAPASLTEQLGTLDRPARDYLLARTAEEAGLPAPNVEAAMTATPGDIARRTDVAGNLATSLAHARETDGSAATQVEARITEIFGPAGVREVDRALAAADAAGPLPAYYGREDHRHSQVLVEELRGLATESLIRDHAGVEAVDAVVAAHGALPPELQDQLAQEAGIVDTSHRVSGSLREAHLAVIADLAGHTVDCATGVAAGLTGVPLSEPQSSAATQAVCEILGASVGLGGDALLMADGLGKIGGGAYVTVQSGGLLSVVGVPLSAAGTAEVATGVAGTLLHSQQLVEAVGYLRASIEGGQDPRERYEGAKPQYNVNSQHYSRSNKTNIPDDAEEVYRRAVPNDSQNPTAWFAVNRDGVIYRYSEEGVGQVHFSGQSNIDPGIRNISDYALIRLGIAPRDFRRYALYPR